MSHHETDETDRSTLPVPEYDQLETGALSARISHLEPEGLQLLLDHERAHGNRLPVTQLFERRLEQLRDGAPSTPGAPGPTPADPPAPAGGSKVSTATQGPAVNPPSQGDPTNPGQPRT